jgi:hypothetical protein
MMNRKDFIDKVVSQSVKTENDIILIDALETIKNYFSSILKEFEKQKCRYG